MGDPTGPDWDPSSENVLRDQRAAYDDMRERCPVARSDFLGYSLFRHEDVMRVLHDPETFSNAVSRHVSIPNGVDPPEHTAFRRLIDTYFTPARMLAFEPECRKIASDLIANLAQLDEVEAIQDLAQSFAVGTQCAFLGWPLDVHEPLRAWTRKNHEATRAQDRKAMQAVAQEFAGYAGEMLRVRRAAGATAGDDITSDLISAEVLGRPLSDEEITSILRNWTVGEVGTISASVGILVHFLAQHPKLQQDLREQPSLLPDAIEEILRLDGPLVANRRVTTRPVEIAGRKIEAGARLSLIWIAANRDGRVFADPESFRLGRDPEQNLLYGAGIHVCPGAPLARLELRVVMEELLGHSLAIEPDESRPSVRAAYPAAGFAAVPVRICW